MSQPSTKLVEIHSFIRLLERVFIALGFIVLLTAPAATQKLDCDFPPPPKFKTEEEWTRWFLTDALPRALKWERENRQSPSMMFNSPEIIDQALKRRLFNKAIIDEVARRELLGKNIAGADTLLKELGFRRNAIKEQTPYHWDEPAGCYTLMLARLRMTLTIRNGVVVGVDTKVRHITL